MLITTEAEYRRTRGIIKNSEKGFLAQAASLAKEGMSKDEIKRALSPFRSQIYDMKGDLEWYENAKRGIFDPIENLEGIGRVLIGLRIASGMTQAELAEKLGVTQPVISEDENDEYHAISVDRVQRILAVFGAKLEGKLILGSALKAA